MSDPAGLSNQLVPEASPELREATVLTDATERGEEIRCTTISLGELISTDPLPWRPFTTAAGEFWPKKGERAVLAFPPDGPPVIAWWEPAQRESDEGISGSASPATPTKLGTVLLDVINARAEGAKGDGEADDTAALQDAIDKAIELELRLYLPPGTYKTTAGLVAATTNFGIFGAGPRLSAIVPDSSAYDALTIGPAEGGSGSTPGGFARDFSIEGGNADQAGSGVEPDTGKAAFKLRAMRLFEVRNVVINGAHDVGFDLVNNCFGTEFHNCSSAFDSCRVGLNLRTGSQSGSDIYLFNSWLRGEVAAVHMAGDAGGFRFFGGQLSSSHSATEDDDDRGTVIAGKDYLTGATGETATCLFSGVSFEGSQFCWQFRAFEQVSMSLQGCGSHGGQGEEKTIGVFKGTEFGNGRLELNGLGLAGEFSGPAAGLLTIEDGGSGRSIIEIGTYGGGLVAGEDEPNVDDEPLIVLSEAGNGVGFGKNFAVLDELLLRNDDEGLELSVDWGASWQDVTEKSKTVASAETITVPPGLRVAKITGTTAIKKIEPTYEGHLLLLRFAANCTLTNGENLRIGSDFNGTENDVIALVYVSGNWHRVAAGAAN
jgi:hypothetical protein